MPAQNDRILQRAFTGGEQSPNLDQRADLARWHTALATCENFVPIVQGGATRRSGFLDVADAQEDSGLVPFVFSANDGYAIEFAEEVCRFYRDFAQLQDGDDPYELDTPFTDEDIADLDYCQSADKLFIACGNRPIQQIARLDTTNWTVGALPVKNGPFMDENPQTGITLSTTTATEIVAGTSFPVLASAALFDDPLHVGALWKISIIDESKYDLWGAGKTVIVGDFNYWGGNLYKATAIHAGTSVKTGGDPPIHTFGEAWDGPGGDSNLGVKWLYLHSGYGIAKITAVTDSTHAQMEAQTYIPSELHDGNQWRWSEGAWSDYRGYPRSVAIHNKRLYAGSTRSQPTRIWASVIDDYPNFKAGTLDTDGFAEALQGASNQVNVIQWLSSGSRMWIGTAGDEFAVPTSSTREPITPSNVVIDGATAEGSARVKPANVGAPIFVSKDGRRLHQPGYDFSNDEYIAPDLTIFADHVTGAGVVQLAWQREPYRLLWALRSDGVLACSTLRKDQQINGWHRHIVPKGSVKSICCVPSPSGIRQDLWAIVEYALEAGTVRRVQSLMPFFERGNYDVIDACFVDCAFQYVGAPAANISGIPDFLEGETVRALADGKVIRPKVVTAGAITLPFAASKVTLGIDAPAKLKTLRYDRDISGGPLTGKKNRVAGIVVDLLRAAAVKIGAGKPPEYITDERGRVMDAKANLMTGPTLRQDVDASWDDDGSATVLCEDPLPCTVRAITLEMQVGG